jgi:hypothetical protein
VSVRFRTVRARENAGAFAVSALRIVATASTLGLMACRHDVIALAQDLALDTRPRRVRFAMPVHAPQRTFAVCVTFERPEDSPSIAQMAIALRDGADRADTLRGAAVRTGRRTMCLRDSTTRAYLGATITAPHRLLVRQLDWRARI